MHCGTAKLPSTKPYYRTVQVVWSLTLCGAGCSDIDIHGQQSWTILWFVVAELGVHSKLTSGILPLVLQFFNNYIIIISVNIVAFCINR